MCQRLLFLASVIILFQGPSPICCLLYTLLLLFCWCYLITGYKGPRPSAGGELITYRERLEVDWPLRNQPLPCTSAHRGPTSVAETPSVYLRRLGVGLGKQEEIRGTDMLPGGGGGP